MKGQGWTLVVILPVPKDEEIKELKGEIQDKKERYTPPLSRIHNGESSSLPHKKLQWVPKKQSFMAQVKEKLKTNKHKTKKPKEDPTWTLHFDGSKRKLGDNIGIELVNPKGSKHRSMSPFMIPKPVLVKSHFSIKIQFF